MPTNTPVPSPAPGAPPAPSNLAAQVSALPRPSVGLSWSPSQPAQRTTFNVYRNHRQPVSLDGAHRIAGGLAIGLYPHNDGQPGDDDVVTAANGYGESGP